MKRINCIGRDDGARPTVCPQDTQIHTYICVCGRRRLRVPEGACLLISLLLHNDGVLRKPLLYPSLYFKEHRADYYAELNAMRATGDYERWIDFFAEAMRHSAQVAISTLQRIAKVFEEDRAQLRGVPRLAGTLLLVQEALQAKPIATIAALTSSTNLTTPTITSALKELETRSIVREITGRARDRVFAYSRYMEALAREDE